MGIVAFEGGGCGPARAGVSAAISAETAWSRKGHGRHGRVPNQRTECGAREPVRAAGRPTDVHDQRATTARLAASRSASRSAAGSASSASSFARRSATSPDSNAARWRSRAGYSASSPAATSARPEWRATSGGQPVGGGLGGDHAERLGEDRRHDRGLGERQQVDEMPVLERAGEERLARGQRARLLLQRAAVVAEADDHGARVEAADRVEQQVHALVHDQLPEVDDDRAARRRGTPRAARRCPRRAAARSRCRGSAGRRAPPRSGRRAPRRAAPGTNSSTSTPGGTSSTGRTRPDDLLDHLPDVRRADERRLRARERLGPPRLEPRPPAHRVLELGPVRLHAERHAARGADGRRPSARGSRRRGRRAPARAAPPRSPRRTARTPRR